MSLGGRGYGQEDGQGNGQPHHWRSTLDANMNNVTPEEARGSARRDQEAQLVMLVRKWGELIEGELKMASEDRVRFAMGGTEKAQELLVAGMVVELEILLERAKSACTIVCASNYRAALARGG